MHDSSTYNLYVISNKPEHFPSIAYSLKPVRTNYFDGSDYPSFSKLVNNCVASCPTETVIIASDKVMPTAEHVYKLLDLLDQGYAFVGLFSFAFFGFRKELFRRIGFMDERFVGGGFEDYDFYTRINEAGLAAYITVEVPYQFSSSSWKRTTNFDFWSDKWWHTWEDGNPYPVSLTRMIPELQYDYDLGPSTQAEFLTHEHSFCVKHDHISPFFQAKIY